MDGKIAVEEHFVTAELEDCISGVGWTPEDWRRVIAGLRDVEEVRLPQMDRFGIERSVLSLGANGIQDVVDPLRAIDRAQQANDALAGTVARHPDRLSGFAALPLQDPLAAAVELRRAVEELGLVGCLVNGYSNIGSDEVGSYYDEPQYEPFWAEVDRLRVPLYLHPRNPLPSQRRVYEGRPELLGPTWAFAVETGSHALRLVTSGLFDRFPRLQVIIGHLGEFLPFAMPRLEQRIAHVAGFSLDRRPTEYLCENFFITTSGNCHTRSLLAILGDLGPERLLFAADYPFEEMADGADWFDGLPISAPERQMIGRANALRLLRLDH